MSRDKFLTLTKYLIPPFGFALEYKFMRHVFVRFFNFGLWTMNFSELCSEFLSGFSLELLTTSLIVPILS